MPEFLVEINIQLPHDLGDDLRRRVDAERVRARELMAAGTIVRLWRLPGRTANVGLWEATDASALHDALSSLPLFPYMHVTVTALAHHPSEVS